MGLYLLVLCGSVVGIVRVQMTTGPVIGGAFVVIGLFWLAVLAAVWASLVVLAINAYRYLRDEMPSRKATTFAVLTPFVTGVAVYLAFITTHYQLSVLVGGLGFLCSFGLIITVFEDRARRVWSNLAH